MPAVVEKEIGMLDVGTHCSFCRELDFLPFHCQYCNKDFCSNHRTKESHFCVWLDEHKDDDNNDKQVNVHKSKDNGGKFFKSLLPEKSSIRVNQAKNNNIKEATPDNKITIKSTLNSSTLTRLKKFFKKNKSSKSSKVLRSNNKVIQLASLQKQAKGDAKIPQQNRIYIWAYAVDSDKTTEPTPLYINKVWPVGRALDSIASNLSISNKNSSVNATETEKLFIYKCVKDEQLVQLNTSERVINNINNLDTLYLIRGVEQSTL